MKQVINLVVASIISFFAGAITMVILLTEKRYKGCDIEKYFDGIISICK